MPQTKQQIRATIAAQRKSFDFQWLERASDQIVTNFLTLEVFHSSETVALYMAIGGEVRMDSLFTECWKRGKRTCIPVFNAERNVYDMAEISPETCFKVGNYGIKEPISPTLVPLDEIDLIAVPGVAFDLTRNRLGRGGGYYDRILEDFGGTSVAVAFGFQILEEIPVDPHDEPVDILITEIKVDEA